MAIDYVFRLEVTFLDSILYSKVSEYDILGRDIFWKDVLLIMPVILLVASPDQSDMITSPPESSDKCICKYIFLNLRTKSIF